jgi:hypothetical protein
MGHDADVAHIVGGPLQLDQLLGRDDRHRGGCVCAVSQAAGATVVPVGSSAMLRGESSRARFGGYQRTVGEQRRAGACGCDRGRDYIAARVVAAKMLKLSGRRRPGTPLPFAHRKKRLRHRWGARSRLDRSSARVKLNHSESPRRRPQLHTQSIAACLCSGYFGRGLLLASSATCCCSPPPGLDARGPMQHSPAAAAPGDLP